MRQGRTSRARRGLTLDLPLKTLDPETITGPGRSNPAIVFCWDGV
ncbi:MAG TPA: hypothetical protein VND23_05610 [Acidimicrobiales bacterium]|nr:hypothetical protein [Acidimicrobiales bacterium]